MKISFNFKPDSKVTLSANGQAETVDLWGRAHKLLEGHAGRINVFDGALSAPSTGRAITRNDGKTTLNLLAETGPAEVSVALPGGRKGLVRTPARAQKRGFASGEHYWLAQDANGRFKPEPGRRHRKIYLSGSAQAMNKAAIAAHAGVAETVVTGAWLEARPHYGGSEAMPLAIDAWILLRPVLQGPTKDSRSDWLRLECGYDYALPVDSFMRGESELHPMVVEAWGTGARPRVSGLHWSAKLGPRFMLVRDIDTGIIYPRYGYGIIFENCRISGTSESQLKDSGMATLRECAVFDVAHAKPGSNRTTWDGSKDRISGLYAASAQNMMFDGCLVDRNGWAEGYDFNRAGTMPMPPSDRNHGLYLTFNNLDVHIRDSLISRNSSCGLQIRVGGQYERNLFVDNNMACGLHSGTALGKVNQFTNFIDNVNFGAGYKKVVSYQGNIKAGFDVTGALTAQIGCVVAHLANPDDPAEVAARKSSRPDWDAGNPYNSGDQYIWNDTQVFAWERSADGSWDPQNERIEGLDRTVLMQTTIQRYTAQKIGRPTATVNDLVEYLRNGPVNQIGETVRDAVQWTKTRFGHPLPVRTTTADLVFRPDPRTEGFRWDNRLNWTTLDLPGTHVADTVDLDGHDVLFGTLDTGIAALKSRKGALDVTSGKLAVGALTDALTATVRNSGQLWLGATSQEVSVKASGGRIRLDGAASRLALEARGNAEVLLGSQATIPAGKALVVSGQRCLAGWDGTGSAVLTVAGTLEFRAGIMLTVGNTAWVQRFVKPGTRVETPGFAATIADYEERSDKTTNRMWLSDLTGLPQPGESFVFGMSSDVGDAIDVEIPLSATVTAVASRGMPMLQRFRSGAIGDGTAEPTVAASLVLAAGSTVVIQGRDYLTAGTHDLTGPGVTVTDNGATLPAGVSVTNGKLVLVVS